jgi:hypothetical protein
MKRRLLAVPEQYVWAVYNSGDPIWTDSPYVIELILFASKHAALDFVRAILKEHWKLDADDLDDEAVENLMFDDGDENVPARYLHLYELRVHPDDYATVTLPF